MTASNEPHHREPLNLRWLPEDRALIDRAAKARGLTRTDFVLGASRDRAMDVLLDQVFIELDPDAFDAFAEQLDANPNPSAELRKTMSASRPWDEA